MATNPPMYSNVTVGVGSLTATAANHNSVISVSGGTGATWVNNNNNAKMSVNGQLTLDGEEADIVINGVKLSSILNGITDRLAILQPKSELLAKYANLREAYEHYKTLEALLHESNNE